MFLILLFLFTPTSHTLKPGKSTTQAQSKPSVKLVPNRITLTTGRSAGSFNLNLPEGFGISIAAEGLKRVRFMAKSPDGRIFVTDMYNLTDNKRGVVYILDQFDQGSRRFNKVTQYLTGLRSRVSGDRCRVPGVGVSGRMLFHQRKLRLRNLRSDTLYPTVDTRHPTADTRHQFPAPVTRYPTPDT